MRRSFPERLSKRATLAAIALAIPLHLIVDPAVGWTLRIITGAAFVAAYACGRRWPRLAPAVVVGAAPIVPVLLNAIVHVAALNVFYTVTIAALLGAMLPSLPRDRWELPPTWRPALGIWALTLSLAWPVLIVREAGFRLGTLRDTGALDSWAFLNTPQVESWILHVVLAQLVGLVWLEWLFVQGEGPAEAAPPVRNAAYVGAGFSRPNGPPAAVHGLWIGTSIASLVAVYQGTVNMAFLSGGVWPGLRRAAGTLLDANAYGTVAALAGPIAFVSIPYLGLRRPRATQAAALALNWAGAWMSGSRTALVCGAFGMLLLMYELLRSETRVGSGERRASELLAGAAVVVMLLVVAAGAVGPLKRMTETGSGSGASLRDLWTRGGYGSVATHMVRDYPLTGVGIGSFNWMAPDYWRVIANDSLPFDNAQNWWRHQVAELGLVASLPVLLWSLLIAWLVLTRRSRPDARVETAALRGLLLGVGLASLLGMPTQNPLVLLVFFYLVARFDMLTAEGPPEDGPRVSEPHRGGAQQLAWAAGVVIAIGYAGGHVVLARGPLEPTERAALTNRDYVIGTYPAERLPVQGQFRWTRKHATFALAARSRYLVIRSRVGNPDAATRPVKLRITTPCQTLIDEFRSDSDVHSRAFELPEGEKRVIFETDVSRTWRPSGFGQEDDRELGAAIEADFVASPSVIESQAPWTPLKSCVQ